MTTRLYYDQSMWIRLAHRLYSDFQYFLFLPYIGHLMDEDLVPFKKFALIYFYTSHWIFICLYIPLLQDSLRPAKRLGTANAKEWGIKVRFPIQRGSNPTWGGAVLDSLEIIKNSFKNHWNIQMGWRFKSSGGFDETVSSSNLI